MVSAAEMNVTFGFVDAPPCVNSFAMPVGSALYAARNVDWSKLKLPFWSSVTPARFGLTGFEPAHRVFHRGREVVGELDRARRSPVSGLRGVGGRVVRGD